MYTYDVENDISIFDGDFEGSAVNFNHDSKVISKKMESFLFSMIMIVLSPLAGIVFSVW